MGGADQGADVQAAVAADRTRTTRQRRGGESAGKPSVFGDFPEILGPALDRYLPSGRLAGFQRYKLPVYGTYSRDMGRFGTVDISPLRRVDSGQVFNYSAASVPSTELARNPGYPINVINPSTALTLFFGEEARAISAATTLPPPTAYRSGICEAMDRD